MIEPKEVEATPADPLSIACPKCGVPQFVRCISPRGVRVGPHRQRVDSVPHPKLLPVVANKEPRR